MEQEMERFEKAVKRVFDRLFSMSPDEFRSELKRHEDGDIGRIFLETGALEVYSLEEWDEDNDLGPQLDSASSPEWGQWTFSSTTLQARVSPQAEIVDWDLGYNWTGHPIFSVPPSMPVVQCESPSTQASKGIFKEISDAADGYDYDVAA